MTVEERELRAELSELAETENGRRLLQLALRGIDGGGAELTAGCWTEGGIAGCLFQHAYWQGVREGVFRDEGRPGDWIGVVRRVVGIRHGAQRDRVVRPARQAASRRPFAAQDPP